MTSLYIHIPFCQRKCFYCSFVVYVGQQKLMDDYLVAVEQDAKRYHGLSMETVYLGGGTPSFIPSIQLERLCAIIAGQFDLHGLKEFTIEVNPEDVDLAKAQRWAELGFTRISLGVQSFQDPYLKFLGRCHSAEKSLEAFRILRQFGFRNINLDLMYGFPDQSEAELKDDLATLIDLGSEHVSIYSLTVEPRSRFYVQQVQVQEGSLQAAFYETIVQQLESSGLNQYEISNFACPGKESLHNLNYWSGGNYVGLGPAAHSHRDGRRSWNVADLNEYLNRLQTGRSPEEGYEELTPQQRLKEALVFGLRMNAGVELENLEEGFGVKLPLAQQKKIEEFLEHGFLSRQSGPLQTTNKGRLVLDELAVYLV